MNRIVIIGGGASGMMAALAATQYNFSNNNNIVVLEGMEKPGKKILSTGNGKCNLTNLYQNLECYNGSSKDFIAEVLTQFDLTRTLEFFNNLGMDIKDKSGYIYPYSEQASSVSDLLRMECIARGIKLKCTEKVEKILVHKNQHNNINTTTDNLSGSPYEVLTSTGRYRADKVIMATGSKAAPKTGSDGSGYILSKRFGHTIIPVVPALMALKAEGKYFNEIAGVRTDCNIKLFINNSIIAAADGELQLTNYGLSGIPVFQISRHAAYALKENKNVIAIIDFFRSYSIDELSARFMRKQAISSYKSIFEQFIGMQNNKLSNVLLKLYGFNSSNSKDYLNYEKSDWDKLFTYFKNFNIKITGNNDFDNAQVCAGGVDTSEINPLTMESKLHKGLFFCGELLDVDGICGGYNLQWAWSTGYIAGTNASQ